MAVKKTLDQLAKKRKNKDYHSEKLLSGKVGTGKYNVAVSGKRGDERYSRTLVKNGRKLESTRTSTRVSRDKNEKGAVVSKNYIKQITSKDGKDHTITSKQSINRSRTLTPKRKTKAKTKAKTKK